MHTETLYFKECLLANCAHLLSRGEGYSHMCGIRGCVAQTGHFFAKKP